MASPAFQKILAKIQKDYPGRMRQATGISDPRRVETGIFNVDRLLGGGLPLNRIALMYGPESTFKTTFSLKIARNILNKCGNCFEVQAKCQCKEPDFNTVAALIDVDQAYQEDYTKNLGIDPKRLYVYSPPSGEAACEAAEELSKIPEVRVVIVDALAELVPLGTLEKGYADSLARGGRALLVNRMIRGLLIHLSNQNPRIAIMINHPLPNVDGTQGHYLPGGRTQLTGSTTILRLWPQGKTKTQVTIDQELEGKVPVRRAELGFSLRKSRVGYCNVNGEFAIFTETVPEQGIFFGDADDFQTVTDWGVKLQLLGAMGENRIIIDNQDLGPRQIINYWKTHPEKFSTLKTQIFSLLREHQQIVESSVVEDKTSEAEIA